MALYVYLRQCNYVSSPNRGQSIIPKEMDFVELLFHRWAIIISDIAGSPPPSSPFTHANCVTCQSPAPRGREEAIAIYVTGGILMINK